MIFTDLTFSYFSQLDEESTKLYDQAKALVIAEQKQRALLVLKLRKHKEKEVEKVDAQLITVLEMLQRIEWQAVSMQVLVVVDNIFFPFFQKCFSVGF